MKRFTPVFWPVASDGAKSGLAVASMAAMASRWSVTWFSLLYSHFRLHSRWTPLTGLTINGLLIGSQIAKGDNLVFDTPDSLCFSFNPKS
jgi:hypothetical protein